MALSTSVGLLTGAGKYVSQDNFGNLINGSGASFKTKQTFVLEQAEGGKVSIKTPKGTYFSYTEKGKLTGDGESAASFEVVVQKEGRWAFKGDNGYYLSSGTEGELNVFAREVGTNEAFGIQFSMHPQLCLFSEARQSYAHLENGELRCNEIQPWGVDSMVSLEFHPSIAKYTLRASNGLFWTCEHKFSEKIDESCHFAVQMAEGQFAFKGTNGKYLQAPTAAQSLMKCQGAKIGNSELFKMSDSHCQVTVVGSNGKYLSMSKGDDAACCATEITDKEIFQLEIQTDGKAAFKTCDRKYLCASSGILSTQASCDDASLFTIDYDGASVIIKKDSKQWNMKPNGGMKFESAAEGKSNKFSMDISNRPQMILKCEHGFVTTKGKSGNIASCGGSQPEAFKAVYNKGLLKLKGENGKFVVSASDGNIATTGEEGDDFALVHSAPSKVSIMLVKSGMYLQGSQQGGLKATAKLGDKCTLWEI